MLVINLKRESLKIFTVDPSSTSKEAGEYPWLSENLAEIIGEIKKAKKVKSARVLLDDDLGYLLDLEIPVNEKDERSYLAKVIAEKIPEVLGDGDWNYREIGKGKNVRKIQVFAPVKSYWQKFTLACQKAGLEIECEETVSMALERSNDPVVGLAKKTDFEKIRKAIKEVVENKKIIENKEAVGGAPAISFMQEEKKEGVDESLGISTESGRPRRKNKLLPFLLLVVLLVVIFGIAFYFVKTERLAKSAKELSAPTSIPTAAVVEPTPAIKKSALKIKVLNGSGVIGQAGVIKKYLEGLGYQNIETGNADNYKYMNISVLVKAGGEDIRKLVGDDMAQKYALAQTIAVLDAGDLFDVIIIVGI